MKRQGVLDGDETGHTHALESTICSRQLTAVQDSPCECTRARGCVCVCVCVCARVCVRMCSPAYMSCMRQSVSGDLDACIHPGAARVCVVWGE
jgi:hypothetical protein